ncbi:MAG: family N-acetyltransferase [Devosia sp.]|nr:family N-acetyltransferase [Devosia sp.]
MNLTRRLVGGRSWDQTVAGFSTICQEQLFAFGRARWLNAELEPLLFFEGDVAVGGALVVIQRLPLRLGTVAVVKWGPVLARKDDGERLYYDEIVTMLKSDYAQHRGMTLSIQPHVSAKLENHLADSLARHGFAPSPDLRPTERYLASLRHSDEELRKNFLPRWRRMLNKSDRSDLAFVRAEADRLPEFDALFRELHARKGLSDRSAYDTASSMLGHEVDAARYELFFATHAGVPVAGIIAFKAGDTAEYLYGASSAAGLALNAGFFLQFNTLRWLRDNTRASWYNLGGTDGSAGLLAFKSGLIGTLGVVRPLPPPMIYAQTLRAKMTGQAAYFIRAWISHMKRRLSDWRDGRKAQQAQEAAGRDAEASS